MLRKFLITALLLTCPTLVFAIDQWVPTVPATSDNPVLFPAAEVSNNNSLSRLLSNYRESQAITYSTASAVSVSGGEVSCNSAIPIILRQNVASTTVTAANLDTGVSFSASSTYYVYANCDASATTNNYTVSLNATTPAGVTNYKQIGNFTTDASTNIAAVNNANFNGVGSWVSPAQNTPAIAQSDLFCTAGFTSPTNTGNHAGDILTDGVNPPTTSRCHASRDGSTFIATSCSTVVRRGDYYKTNIADFSFFYCVSLGQVK